MKGTCKICKKNFTGRRGKIYCSPACKAIYHQKLTKVTDSATYDIDKILHRNRKTLLEIMGKASTSKKVDRSLLDSKKFNWHFITHTHTNSQGKMVFFVYDFSYIIFSDQEVLIKKIRSDKSVEEH
jgi:hypothetical protein